MKRTLCISFLLLVQSNLFAQWTQTSGPSGGGVSDFAFVGTTILAATFDIGNGVFASTDNGTSWHQSGLQGEMLTHMTANANTVLASNTQNSYNETDTVFRSTDGGTSWHPSLIDQNIDGIISICYFNHQWLISTEGLEGGIFKSNDDGATWEAIHPANFVFTYPVILVPVNAFVLAGTNNDGHINVYQSPDGTTYTLPTPGVDPTLTSEVYCAAVSGSTVMFGIVGGIIYSKDGGISWTQPLIKDIVNKSEYITHIAGFGNDVVAISSLNHVFVSHDGAQSWNSLNGNGLPANASYFFSIGFDPSGTTVYLGSSSGILSEKITSNNWNYSTEGLLSASISELAVGKGKLFAATERGVSYSPDAGSTWHDPQNLSDLQDVPIVSFLNGPGTFYAYGSGLYSWNDANANWNMLDTDQITAFAEGTSAYLFAAKQTGDPITGTGEIDISIDGGNNWTPSLSFTNSFDTEFYFMPRCIATNGNGTIVTVQRANIFLTFSSVYTIYRSNDNGSTWTMGSSVDKPEFLYYADNEFYMGTATNGLFHSGDNGVTWGKNNGIPSGADVTSLIKNNGSLFISVTGNGFTFDGLFYSNDDGSSWNYANFGNANIYGPLATDGTYLFSGGPSVWRRPMKGLGVQQTKLAGQNASLELYPNPAGDIIHAHFASDLPIEGTLFIYDEKGMAVAKQEVNALSSSDDLPISLTGISDGAYYAKLMDKNGAQIATSRFVVQRK